MRVRALDANGDMRFGRGQADFYRDVPEAPAQCALTRLMLFEAEWYQDLREGTPWNTQVLGKRTGDTRDPVIQDRILGTDGVTKLTAYGSVLDRGTRGFTVTAAFDTAYGPASLSGVVAPPVREAR